MAARRPGSVEVLQQPLAHLGRIDLVFLVRTRHPGTCELVVNGTVVARAGVEAGEAVFKIADAAGALGSDLVFQVNHQGAPLRFRGGETSWRVDGPFVAQGEPRRDILAAVATGQVLSKKGRFFTPLSGDHARVALEFFATVNEVFTQISGRPLLITHGTLLGVWRDGALIEHDDDVDCAYLSRHSRVVDVVGERNALLEALVGHFPGSHIGATGHIKVPDQTGTIELDIMPSWVEGKTLHVSSYGSFAGRLDLVASVSQVECEGVALPTFSDPEAFLSLRYGPSWSHPDPGYRYPARTGEERRNLLCLSPRFSGTGSLSTWWECYQAVAQMMASSHTPWCVVGQTLRSVARGWWTTLATGPGCDPDLHIVVGGRGFDERALRRAVWASGHQLRQIRGSSGATSYEILLYPAGSTPWRVPVSGLTQHRGVWGFAVDAGRSWVELPSVSADGDLLVGDVGGVHVPQHMIDAVAAQWGPNWNQEGDVEWQEPASNAPRPTPTPATGAIGESAPSPFRRVPLGPHWAIRHLRRRITRVVSRFVAISLRRGGYRSYHAPFRAGKRWRLGFFSAKG